MSSKRVVEPAVLVLEHAQAGDAAGEAVGRRGPVRLGDAEEDAEPGPDLADDLAADEHPGLRDTLNDRSHRREPTRLS